MNSKPEPGPENTVPYGPYSEHEHFKRLQFEREASINNKYNESNTTQFKKIVIEEEKIDYKNLSVIKSKGGSVEGRIIKIDEDDDNSFLERERENEIRDWKKNGILAKSRNKLVYLFKEEVYKTAYEDEKIRGRLREVDNVEFSELLFFQDDRLNLSLRYIAQENKQYYRHKFSLNLWFYLESLILHFLQISVIGPFVYIIAIFHWPYFTFFNNMNFFNLKSPSFYTPLLFWFSILSVIIGRYFLEYKALDDGFLAMMLTMALARSSIIASKYATFTDQYRDRCLGRKIGENEKKLADSKLLGKV